MIDAFGEFRSVLAKPASIETFDALCELVGHSGQLTPQVAEYAVDHLERWPEHITRAPLEPWVDALMDGASVPALVLCDTLRLVNWWHRDEDERWEYDPDSEEPIIEPRLHDERLAELLGTEYVRGLRVLDLGQNMLTTKSARAIAECEHLIGLRVLNLRDNALGDEGARAIARSPFMANLTTLNLHTTKMTWEGAEAIASSAHLTKLRHLDLRYNRIGERGAMAIAHSPSMAGLRTLALYHDDVGPEGAQALGGSDQLSAPIRSVWRGRRV